MSNFAGHLHLRAASRADGRTVLAAQSFRAPFHLSKPYWDPDTGVLVVQVVNPTAGILSGDRLQSELMVDHAAALLATTPSASRLFRMNAGQAECRQRFEVKRGGWLEVMPEPLVPHRGSQYRQTTVIEVETGAGLFFVDQLMPGRLGHDEAWLWDRLTLDLTLRVNGQLVLRERLDLSGAEMKQLADFAGHTTAPCFANAMLLGAASSETWLPSLRALHGDGVWLGVSALRDDAWTIRVIAASPIRLRDTLRHVRGILAPAFPRLRCDTRKL